MVRATYKVVIGWNGVSDTDETARTKRISIRRGRDSEMGSVQAGTCTLTMVDTDGRFNPLNSASPLYGQTTTICYIEVTATYNAVEYMLFSGFTRRVISNPDRSAQEATIECADLLWIMSRNKPTIASSSTTVGLAIQAMTTLIHAERAIYPASVSFINGNSGDAITFSADGSKTALAIVGELLTTDRGLFYISQLGQAMYESRYAINTSPRTSVQSTITGTMRAMAPGWDADSVRNRITVTKTGGTAQTASDATSIAAYGGMDYAAITSTYLDSDTVAASLASWLVVKGKDGISPIRTLELTNKSDAPFTALLTRDLNDRVSATEALTGSSVDGHIQSITHEIDWRAGTHFGRWGILQRDAKQPFLIGISTIGGADVITY